VTDDTNPDPADVKTDPLFQVDEREAKLPAWARNLLDLARRRVREAEELAERARLDTAPGDSPIVLDHRGPHGESQPIGLGRRPWVRCVLSRYPDGDARAYIEFSAEIDRATGAVVGADVRGSDTLRIAPMAANDVKVYLEER
jgi:hypothetical protein